jgi:hypothetical protein
LATATEGPPGQFPTPPGGYPALPTATRDDSYP